MKKARKIIALFVSLVFGVGLFACEGGSVFADDTCTLTLVQEGQKDVVLEVNKGDTPEFPEPVQSNIYVITEWNVADDFVAESDQTIYTTSYTSGLIFGIRDYNLQTSVLVQNYEGECPEVIIPQYYKGYPIKILDQYAFKNKKHVTKIVLPEGLEEVRYYPFQGIPNLVSVNIPSTLKVLHSYAFCDAKNTGTVTVPGGVISVPDHAFLGFRGERVIFDEGIETIAKFVFAGKNSLKELVLPTSVKEISFLAFCWQPIERIFYMGREGDFNNIKIIDDRAEDERIDTTVKMFDKKIEDGDIDVYYYSEKEPSYAGNFWHYVDGEIAIWE